MYIFKHMALVVCKMRAVGSASAKMQFFAFFFFLFPLFMQLQFFFWFWYFSLFGWEKLQELFEGTLKHQTSVLLAFPLLVSFSYFFLLFRFFFVHQTAAQKNREKEGKRRQNCLLNYRMQLHIMQCNNVMYVYHKSQNGSTTTKI